MRNRFLILVLCGSLPTLPALAQAQSAIETARSLDACGSVSIASARWMRDGSLKVVCNKQSRTSDETPPGITPGATNVVGLLIPALGLGAAVAAAAGASSSPSATSSTGSN